MWPLRDAQPYPMGRPESLLEQNGRTMHCPLSDSAPHSDLLNLGLGCSPMSCLEAEWELVCMSVVRPVKMPCLLATLERKPNASSR